MINPFDIILFDNFETLDAFGPVEIIGCLPQRYELRYLSQQGGVIQSAQNVKIATLPFSSVASTDVVLIPGGQGTRPLVNDGDFIADLKAIAKGAKYVLTVCTGAALLAKTGLLDGKRATTNKRAFDWVRSQGADVRWQKRARWTNEGNLYTSSGVSAGLDMTLGFVADRADRQTAEDICARIEYLWNDRKDDDPFAVDTVAIPWSR